MKELFLIACLSLPASNFTRPAIVPYQMAHDSEEKKLIDWIKKNNPGAEVFIHENPQEDWLHREGFERVPFRYRDKQIWIRRKPVSDQRKLRECA